MVGAHACALNVNLLPWKCLMWCYYSEIKFYYQQSIYIRFCDWASRHLVW